MKCFYCGRNMTIVTNEDGQVMAKCTYPRCRLKPETDWEPDITLVEADLQLIKNSLRGK